MNIIIHITIRRRRYKWLRDASKCRAAQSSVADWPSHVSRAYGDHISGERASTPERSESPSTTTLQQAELVCLPATMYRALTSSASRAGCFSVKPPIPRCTFATHLRLSMALGPRRLCPSALPPLSSQRPSSAAVNLHQIRLYASNSKSNASPPPAERERQSFPDPDRPDLFYHLFYAGVSPSETHISSVGTPAPVFALSFLPTAPPSLDSCAILGWLPAEGGGEGAGLNDFRENGASAHLTSLPTGRY